MIKFIIISHPLSSGHVTYNPRHDFFKILLGGLYEAKSQICFCNYTFNSENSIYWKISQHSMQNLKIAVSSAIEVTTTSR